LFRKRKSVIPVQVTECSDLTPVKRSRLHLALLDSSAVGVGVSGTFGNFACNRLVGDFYVLEDAEEGGGVVCQISSVFLNVASCGGSKLSRIALMGRPSFGDEA